MPLTRQQLSQIYRPVSAKFISTSTPQGFSAATFGGSQIFTQQVDLTLPLRGFRLIFKGRLVVGTAAFTTPFPESFLNLLSRIQIFGTNSRAKGNVQLWDIDLATLYSMQFLFATRPALFDINGTPVTKPGMPYTAANALSTGTFDWRIAVDLPAYPMSMPFASGARPQFLIRDQEWKDTIVVQLNYGTQAGAGATGALGVSAGTTTVAFSAFGSGAGTPTVDIYSLPVIMGLDLKDTFTPGYITRVSAPITTILQQAGPANTTLFTLEKQPTSRIFAKFGTSTFPNGNPAFATLTDTNVSTLGLVVGQNRFVRNNVDLFAHKQELLEAYQYGEIVQGYNCFDFLPSGNPDADYPGDQVGTGATFQLQGTTAGVANAAGIIIQEEELYSAEGPLYSF